jgi:hypothetical protein
MEAAYPFKTLVPIYQTTCVTSQKMRILNKDAELNKIHLYFRPWASFIWVWILPSPMTPSHRRAVSCFLYSLTKCHLRHMIIPVRLSYIHPFSYFLHTAQMSQVLTSRMANPCFAHYFCQCTFLIFLILILLLWYMTFQMGMIPLSHVSTIGTAAFSIYFSI